MIENIFLPGTDRQIKLLIEHLNVKGMTVLIMGSGSERIAVKLKESEAESVLIIVDDNDVLLNSRLLLSVRPDIQVRMMEYDNTDFIKPKFDLIYAQASISNKKRSKIVKEVKRILKPGGYFCVGENISLSLDEPAFIKDIWKNSNISPLYIKDAEKYYKEKGFKVHNEFDLSSTLKEFYKNGRELLEENIDSLEDNEKSYYKKLLKQISHESNAYLKLGGNTYMGFRMFILRKDIE